MKLEKREYQQRAIRVLPGLLLVHRRVIAVAPTGSGKTVIAAGVLREMIGKRVLWLAHRVELLRQARRHLEEAGIPPEWIRVLSGTEKSGSEDALITIASIGMVGAEDAPRADLIVIDEAHRSLAASYVEILDAQPDALVLGLTATPWRLDGQGLGDVFRHMFVMVGMTEVVADGFLVRPVTYGIPRKKARAMLKGIKAGRDYQIAQLAAAMSKRTLLGDAVAEWERLALDVPTIAFAVNRHHGRQLMCRFAEAGHAVGYVDGDTSPGERDALLANVRAGIIKVLVNVDVLSEGIDIPPVKCIILARPTKSLTRFLQYVGRASRRFGNKRPIVIDHAGNCWLHGLPEIEREWTLDGKPRGGHREVPMRYCEACGAMNPVAVTECRECGEPLPRSDREIREEQARLEKLRLEENDRKRLEEIVRKLAERRGLGEEWVVRALMEVA